MLIFKIHPRSHSLRALFVRSLFVPCTVATLLMWGSAAAQTASQNHRALNPSVGRSVVAWGDRAALGNGYLHSYVVNNKQGQPLAVGIQFPASTLEQLPGQHNDGANCWDGNNDHDIDLEHECSGGHGRVLAFPRNGSVFDHATVNWEPHGHVPTDVYDIPHFDFHFYMISVIERNLIAVGSCFGTIDCTVRQTAIKAMPPGYMPSDFLNTELAFSRMGNHWVDGTSPELNGGVFTQTFIYGSFDSRLTFYEPMVTREYLLSRPNRCTAIKQASLVSQSGYYPTRYCIRYAEVPRPTYWVSLEGFVYKSASDQPSS